MPMRTRLGVTSRRWASRSRASDLLNLLTVTSVELAGGIALALGHRSPNSQPNYRAFSSLDGSTKTQPDGSPDDYGLRTSSREFKACTDG
jgi:hypothetical protein